MIHWLFTWKGVALCGAVVFASLAFGILVRESTFGNVASIVGLAVSLLGFTITVWSVREAQQQIREAGDRAESAIAEVRKETRRNVAAIAAQLLAADCAALRAGVEDLRQAAIDLQWPRAVYRCQETLTFAYRLAEDHHLTEEESLSVRKAADDIQLIRRFIEKNRLDRRPGTLQEQQLQALAAMAALLASIQARLHHEPLRPTEDLHPGR